MPQTLMAILAMMTVTLASLHQQRTLLESRRAMLDDEMEIMASGLALQTLEYIGTKSFDEATINAVVTDTEDLRANFPTGRRCPLDPSNEGAPSYDTCDDLSDYNAMSWEMTPFAVQGDTLLFEVTADVGYVDASHTRTATQTFNKEVVVTVRQLVQDGEQKLLRQPVAIARTYSY